MVIRVYQSQIRADKRPTVSSSPSINTGASEFYASLSDTISRTGNELGEFYIKKKEKELELESQVETGAINDELTDLYNSYLDPQNDINLSPEKWLEGDDSFQDKAQSLINKKYSTIENKIVADTVKAKFQENFLTLEKDLTKESFKRTDQLLEQNLNLRQDNLIDDMSKSNSMMDMSRLTDDLYEVINVRIRSGYYDKGETAQSIYMGAMQTVVKNRILEKSQDMDMSDFMMAYEDDAFGQDDEITNVMLGVLGTEEKTEIINSILDLKIEKIDKLEKYNNTIDDLNDNILETGLIKAQNESDPIAKAEIYKNLKTQFQGDITRTNLIKASESTFDYSSVDTIDVVIEKGKINQGREYGYLEIIALRSKVTKETFQDLHDTYIQRSDLSSPLVNRLRQNIKDSIYSTDDEYIKSLQDSNPELADAYNDASSIYVDKFNKLIQERKLSPIEAKNQVMAEAQSFIENKKIRAAQTQIDILNNLNIMTQAQLFIDIKNIEQSKKNINNTDIADFQKTNIINQLNGLQTIFGADIFTKLANQ
tara:strand:+ start:76 stop:1692 length:1617 start_codon:yes stop_codon:yes gene_type:complete